jgi:DNA repair exonuclease SbcCD nuclease subunit
MIARYDDVLEKIESFSSLKKSFEKAVKVERCNQLTSSAPRILKRLEDTGVDIVNVSLIEKLVSANAKAAEKFSDPILKEIWNSADQAARFSTLWVITKKLENAAPDTDFKKIVSKVLKSSIGAQFEALTPRDLL